MRWFAAFVFLLVLFIATYAFAQQPAQPPTPHERAVTEKLISEINAGLTCNAAVIALQDQIKKLQAQIKEADDKKPPKKP